MSVHDKEIMNASVTIGIQSVSINEHPVIKYIPILHNYRLINNG